MKIIFSRSLCSFFIFIILLHIGYESVHAQAEKESLKNLHWINAGLGVSSMGSFGGNAGLSIQYGKLIYTLRGTANSEEYLRGGDEFFDVGLLIGIASETQKSHASISIGIAIVTGSRYQKTPSFFGFGGKSVDIIPTIGLPIESQLFLKLSRSIGMGFNIYLNINKEEPFGGITLNLLLGKVK